jgi:hypothetical protein
MENTLNHRKEFHDTSIYILILLTLGRVKRTQNRTWLAVRTEKKALRDLRNTEIYTKRPLRKPRKKTDDKLQRNENKQILVA